MNRWTATLAGLLLVPVLASAQTTPTIASLQSLLATLEAELATLQATHPAPTPCAVTITRTLTVGSKGTDVTNLQQTLDSLGYLTVTPTGYYGVLTQAAVEQFQASKGLEQVGYTGPKTRAALASLSCNTTQPPVTTTTGSAGTPATITNYSPPSVGGGGNSSSGAGASAPTPAPVAPLETTSSAVAVTTDSSTAQTPGPSQALFNTPFYSCTRNFYVATNGSDSNAGTQTSPWLTIQHADNASRQAGDCINVAPGTYAKGATITHGGNTPMATGYVVYRCTALDACTITDPNYGFRIVSSGSGPNYVVFDGFDLAASSEVAYGQGIYVWDGGNGAELSLSSNHVWVINNIIHGYGQSGVQLNDGEYFYTIHNTVYNNSFVTCDAQGSGISYVVEKAFPGYTPRGMDLTYDPPFRLVVNDNITDGNMLKQCGSAGNPYDTDGNGIIMDTFDNQGGTNVLYPYQSLVAGNLTYGNGGKGIQIFRTSFVTVANNTSYDNNLDPYDNGTGRGEINQAGGRNNTYVNNIAYVLLGAGILADNSAFLGGSSAGETDADNTWVDNISFGGTPPFNEGPSGNAFFSPDVFSCTSNKCNVNPLLVNPAGNVFTLQPGSPAIGYAKAESYLPGITDVGVYQSGIVVNNSTPAPAAPPTSVPTITQPAASVPSAPVAAPTGSGSTLSNGLLGYWSLDSSTISGTSVTDLSGSGNTGTLSGSPASVAGESGQGLAFLGAQSINIGHGSSLNITGSYTVSMWVYVTTAANTAGEALFQKGQIYQKIGFLAYLDYGNNLKVHCDINSTAEAVSSAALTVNQWNQVVCEYDGSALSVYINGVRSGTFATSANPASSASADLYFGNSLDGHPFSGNIDEIRVYNRALSAAEVQSLYTSP